MSVQGTSVQNLPQADPPKADPSTVARPVGPVADALWAEFAAIHQTPIPPVTTHGPDASLRAYYAAARAQQQAALCLSGGGIRSAAFALGVLQVLARKRLLTRFHYLSTVSGGGYIGGWLTALIHAQRVDDQRGDAAGVERLLAGPETPAAVASLRRYTNFLTPEPGLASPDTWAGVLLWLRNTLINWLLFLPAMFAIAQLPALYADLLQTVGPATGWPLLLAGLLSLGIGVHNGAAHLPSHAPPSDPAQRPPARAAQFARQWVAWPILVWAALAPLVAAPSLRPVLLPGTVSDALIPLGSFAVMLLAYGLAGLRLGAADRVLFRRNFGAWTLGCLGASVVLAAAIASAADLPARWLAVLAPLSVTTAHLVQSLLFVALRQEAFRGELDREWLARLNAFKVVPALLWAGFATVCLVLPGWVFSGAAWRWAAAAVGVLTGPGAALLGHFTAAAPTVAGKPGTSGAGWTDVIVAVAALLFGILLAMVLAHAGAGLAEAFAPAAAGLPPEYRPAVDAALIALPFLLSLWLGRRINVNRFSMHAVYRNRLVRAFLGSARRHRTPDGFTGLDPADNPRMADVFARTDVRALYPVVNVTLNLTAGGNTAWAERKAASFTITPGDCGAAFLHRSEDVRAMKPVRGAYAETARFAGAEQETGPQDTRRGITLGTAITLSGAAVSPSMGYHSMPSVAFLMTLFNVRLGAWLPNPAVASATELAQARPPNALFTLARELLGMADGRSPAVYLTDGGHFDNLGLYEMVRRRCRFILVVDAGEDGSATFADLGNAVRKIAIDFDIRIRFAPPLSIGGRADPVPPWQNHALAAIEYPEGWSGTLLYLRPCRLADPPIDVRAYAADHPAFPHESTLDQWFTESQFESYRRLGEEEAARIGTGSYAGAEALGDFFRDAGSGL